MNRYPPRGTERELAGEQEITIRPLESIDDFHAAEDLQREVWSGSEADVIPLHVLTTVAHNGGLVLGAFDGPVLVGYLFGFLGTENETGPAASALKHCSHQLGVRPSHGGRGIGRRLKLEQRERVLAVGVRLVTWTYNPMEVRNGRLNISRLGGICRRYLRNLYGEMADGLNAGTLSDRFFVEWHLESAHVRQRLARNEAEREDIRGLTMAGVPVLNPSRDGAVPCRREEVERASGPRALVEVPADFRGIRALDPALARSWQLQTRAIFEGAFAEGYAVTDLVKGEMDGRMRFFYLVSSPDRA
jgi:predicted GNAT superfamily acetyltransferase